MSSNDDLKFEWWRLACEKSDEAIAFVNVKDQFLFCNNAWSKLLGYTSEELYGKTWQSITKVSDIGADEAGTQKIKDGNRDEYYIEKKYVKKNRSVIEVKLYVHRYPEHGQHEGYIVFCKPIASEEYEDLKEKFLDLQKDVLLLQQNKITSEIISNQIEMIEQKLDQNKELTKIALRGKVSNINVGDKLSGRDYVTKAGNNANIGNSINVTVITVVIVALFITLFSSIFFLVYLLNGK